MTVPEGERSVGATPLGASPLGKPLLGRGPPKPPLGAAAPLGNPLLGRRLPLGKPPLNCPLSCLLTSKVGEAVKDASDGKVGGVPEGGRPVGAPPLGKPPLGNPMGKALAMSC